MLSLIHIYTAGLRCYLLNPADVRHYARAVGLRSKTDRVDALVLARYVQAELARVHVCLLYTSRCV